MFWNIYKWFHSQECDQLLTTHNCFFSNWIYHYQWLVIDNHTDNRQKFSCCLPYCRWCLLDKKIEWRLSVFQKHWKKYQNTRFRKLQQRVIRGVWLR